MDKTATEPAAKKRLEFDQPLSCRPKRQKVVIITKTQEGGARILRAKNNKKDEGKL